MMTTSEQLQQRRHDPKRRGCLLRRHHEIRYAVIITDRALVTNEPEIVHCLFCMHFGREVLSNIMRTRKPIKKVKTFKAPFRVDHFTQHHKIHHIARWEFYCGLNDDEKKVYFSSDPFSADEVLIDLPQERAERTRGPYKVTPKCTTTARMTDLRDESHENKERKEEAEQALIYSQQRQQAELEIAKKNLELKQIEVISSVMMARQKLLDAGVSLENVDRALPFPGTVHVTNGSHSISL